jgi:hypothetical protein
MKMWDLTDCSEPREPFIQWNHVDGPLLCCSDSSLHWITWRERLMLWLGLTTVARIDAKRRHFWRDA